MPGFSNLKALQSLRWTGIMGKWKHYLSDAVTREGFPNAPMEDAWKCSWNRGIHQNHHRLIDDENK